MTPEMAFECLVVTPDPAVFTTMEGILQDFSIATKVCPHPSKASNLLEEGSTDLIVIDLETANSSEFLGQIGKSKMWQKPTVLGVSDSDCITPGVHVILRKPVTRESGLTSLKAAYSRMVRDYRRYTRFAVMTQVVATDAEKRSVKVTVTNIGVGGIGLQSIETLRIGSTLCFRMRLPQLQNEILIQARVLWTRPYGAAGCEFVHVPPFDLQLLHAWLDSRYRIKKPSMAIRDFDSGLT
jgi:hypothetical protein